MGNRDSFNSYTQYPEIAAANDNVAAPDAANKCGGHYSDHGCNAKLPSDWGSEWCRACLLDEVNEQIGLAASRCSGKELERLGTLLATFARTADYAPGFPTFFEHTWRLVEDQAVAWFANPDTVPTTKAGK